MKLDSSFLQSYVHTVSAICIATNLKVKVLKYIAIVYE